MKLFLDTNILLDVLERRHPFFHSASHLWSMVELGKHEGFISAISFNNINYLVQRHFGPSVAQRAMEILAATFKTVPLTQEILVKAIASHGNDFEDAIQFHSAINCQATHLLTRNGKDYPQTALAIMTPDDFLCCH